MMSNELPTEAGLYWWRTAADEWLCMVVYRDDELGLCASEMGECSMDILDESFKPIGQWLRIPGPDAIVEMQHKADQWDALGRTAEQSADPTCQTCGKPRSNHPYRHPFITMEATDND